MSEMKTIGEWIASLPEGELKTKMQHICVGPVVEESATSMKDAFKKLARIWYPSPRPYWFCMGVQEYLDGGELAVGDNKSMIEGWELAKKAIGKTMEMMQSPAPKALWPETKETVMESLDEMGVVWKTPTEIISEHGATTVNMPNLIEPKRFLMRFGGDQDIVVKNAEGEVVHVIKPGETKTFDLEATHVEVPKSEYDRLLAVERAYNILCEEMWKENKGDHGRNG